MARTLDAGSQPPTSGVTATRRVLALLLAPLLGLWSGMQVAARAVVHRNPSRFARDTRAVIDMRAPFAVIGVILGAVVVFLLIAALFSTFADSVADVNENLTDENVTFGDETTDTIKPVFAIVLGLVALTGIVGLALRAFSGGN